MLIWLLFICHCFLRKNLLTRLDWLLVFVMACTVCIQVVGGNKIKNLNDEIPEEHLKIARSLNANILKRQHVYFYHCLFVLYFQMSPV